MKYWRLAEREGPEQKSYSEMYMRLDSKVGLKDLY